MEATRNGMFIRKGDTPAEATPIGVNRELLAELLAERDRIEAQLHPSKRNSQAFYVEQALRRGIEMLRGIEPIHNPFGGS